MKVVDLTDEHRASYYVCLEDWSEEIKEAGDHKECWCNKMKDKGLGVKLALNDAGKAVGMIQYIPVEHSPAYGNDLYFTNCIWVHGYKKGVGNHQKKGIGKALLRAAEQDVQERGAKGLVAWGIPLPFWMKASWYRKQGYTKVDQQGFLGAVLLWKPFSEDAVAPKWIRRNKKPEKIPGKITVTGFINGCCPAQNIVFERAKRASSQFGDKVIFREINTFNRKTLLDWGISDAVYINHKKINSGPPPSYKSIKKQIARQVNKL